MSPFQRLKEEIVVTDTALCDGLRNLPQAYSLEITRGVLEAIVGAGPGIDRAHLFRAPRLICYFKTQNALQMLENA